MNGDTTSGRSPNGRESPPLRWVALLFACTFGALAAIFAAGEAMADPGGLLGIGLVALWVVPLVVLAILAWFRPVTATRVLAVLAAVVIAVSIWFTIDPDGWRSFESGHGPVRAMGVFVLMVPLALLGWHRPVLAGALLVAMGIVPVLLAAGATRAGLSSTMVMGVPAAIDGALYLLSSLPARPATRHRTPAGLAR